MGSFKYRFIAKILYISSQGVVYEKKTILIITFFILVFLFACSNKEEIAAEFVHYYNEEWIPILLMKKDKMDDVQRMIMEIEHELEENSDDETVSIYKEEIIDLIKLEFIPVADDVVDRFKNIQLEHKEIIKLNELQIEAEEFARTVMDSGIDYYKGDITEEAYKKKENELEKRYVEVSDYIDRLMEKYSVEFDADQDSVNGFHELRRTID